MDSRLTHPIIAQLTTDRHTDVPGPIDDCKNEDGGSGPPSESNKYESLWAPPLCSTSSHCSCEGVVAEATTTSEHPPTYVGGQRSSGQYRHDRVK
jgi:hypothetical protein